MAILAYDDVMLREPRLLVPGQQPLGLVTLNKAVPWVNNIVGGFLKHNLKDYKGPSSWASTVPMETIEGTQGFGPFPNVTSSYVSQSYAVVSAYPHTIGVRVYLKSGAASGGCFLSVSNAIATSRLQMDYTSGAIRGIHVNAAGGAALAELAVATGKWLSVVFVGESATNRRLFIGNSMNANTTSILITGWTATTFGFLNKGTDSNAFADGYIADPVFVNGALSDGEAQTWANDYYQFLIPA